MSKHTSGPWYVEEEPAGILVVAEKPGLCVSVTVPGRKTTAEDRANARLIAAAPELLNALKTVLSGDSHTWSQRAEKAIAVIAKAEGKE
jgi:hypothetical protein